MNDSSRLSIGDLADLGGVSRRTVRYYVQEGLLPPPLGVGRGRHYDRRHLEQLLKVKALQEAGGTLDDIRRALSHPMPPSRAAAPAPQPAVRSVWLRLNLAPGVELQVARGVRLPPPGRLQELADWCRAQFARTDDDEDEDA